MSITKKGFFMFVDSRIAGLAEDVRRDFHDEDAAGLLEREGGFYFPHLVMNLERGRMARLALHEKLDDVPEQDFEKALVETQKTIGPEKFGDSLAFAEQAIAECHAAVKSGCGEQERAHKLEEDLLDCPGYFNPNAGFFAAGWIGVYLKTAKKD